MKKKRKKGQKSRRAFTLVELLIASAIFALVSVAVYSTFNSGMNVWRRVKEVNIEQRKIVLKLEKLAREIRQTFKYENIGFAGDKEKIYFAQVLDSELVRITYSFDKDKKTLSRGVNSLEEILEEKEDKEKKLEPEYTAYLSNIADLSFSYFYFDTEENAHLWKEEWKEEEGLPLAIKLEIETQDEKNYAETIFIPVSYIAPPRTGA